MQQLLYLLPALACPLGMGAMMFFMMRPGGKQTEQPPSAERQEIADLRQQVQLMRAEQQRRARTDSRASDAEDVEDVVEGGRASDIQAP
jgi:hypothetical protein